MRYAGIYLNDHLGGSYLGGELAKRAAHENRGTELGQCLERLYTEIIEDRRGLEEVMRRLGVERSRVKPPLAWLAEKLGRLKLNGQLTGYSPLSRLVELEGLSLGVEGKRLLWLALAETGDPRLEGIDLGQLTRRAEAQRNGIEEHRLAAARIALR